jgi:hypothetical protein
MVPSFELRPHAFVLVNPFQIPLATVCFGNPPVAALLLLFKEGVSGFFLVFLIEERYLAQKPFILQL